MINNRYYKFNNRMNGFPLLQSYLCSFENSTGNYVEPTIDKTDIEKSICFVLDTDGTVYYTDILNPEHRKPLSFNSATDIWMALRIFPFAQPTYIPIFNGKICTNLSKWRHSEEKVVAQVIKQVPSGFLVRVDNEPAFLPNAFVSEYYRDNPTLLYKLIFECEVICSDGMHPPVVKTNGPFSSFQDRYGCETLDNIRSKTSSE